MTTFHIIPITQALAVSRQLQAVDFAALAAKGIGTIINNRPDDEEPGQLAAAEAGRFAAEHGMTYRHLPVTMATLSPADVEIFGRMLAEADGPVHAHCRSGQRSATLWMLSEIRSGRMSRDDAQKRLVTAGLDPKPGLVWLDRQDAGLA